ncbi:MAG TPA: hypothetical protein PKY59_21940 [Pyrinomonadaceae bacterium]|nr:hypothetical protein [Pyrinomonadaceae bacterium]
MAESRSAGIPACRERLRAKRKNAHVSMVTLKFELPNATPFGAKP